MTAPSFACSVLVSRGRRQADTLKVEITSRNHSTNMSDIPGYLNDFRLQLLELIEQGNSGEAVRFASDKVLQSYKNGLKTGSLGSRKTR